MIERKDLEFMRRAMELAGRGHGFVHPNPYVGALIVKDCEVLAEGWHERCGDLHAERNALAKLMAGVAQGATLYVTLEPCCHYGKTPPCTDAIIESGISRVVVGIEDPNPLVAGKGFAKLREAGIEVECGVLEEELREQNRIFLKYITTRMPWVALKSAMTLDGKIATVTGDSQWVTSEEARHYSQLLRAEFASILVGVGTVMADDPMLTCRLEGEVHQPIRIVADSKASIPLNSKLVASAREFRTIVAHTASAPDERLEPLRAAGVETLLCSAVDSEMEMDGVAYHNFKGNLLYRGSMKPQNTSGRVDVVDLLGKLGEMGIDSVILEGGGTLSAEFLRQGCIDEVFAFVAPKFVGGSRAKTPIEGEGIERMADAVALEFSSVERVGPDILIRAKFPL